MQGVAILWTCYFFDNHSRQLCQSQNRHCQLNVIKVMLSSRQTMISAEIWENGGLRITAWLRTGQCGEQVQCDTLVFCAG